MKTNTQKVFNLFYPKLILVFFLVLLLGVYIKTFAIGSPYSPGDTLDPACAPGEVNCYVSVGAALTFSTGLTNTANTITNNLSTGVSGGQSVIGGTASGNDLTLSSTAHATKGKIIFGTSAYDEANNRLGIGTVSPDQAFVVQGADVSSEPTFMRFDSGVLTLEGDTSGVNGVPIIDFKDSFTDQVLSRMGYVNNRGIVISNYRSGLGNEAIFFEHSADEHSLVVVYGVSAYGIESRVGIGTDTPSSRLDVVSNNLGTTQTTASGIALSNTHTALNGLQQMSPALRWSGHGWKTDAVAGSQDVEFRAYVTPVQGTANPTGYLGFGSSINGGAYNDNQLVLTSAGFVGIGMTGASVALDVTGDIEYTGTITDVSDERLKENITDFESGLAIVNAIGVKNYNMIASPDKAETGFIAQNVNKYFPQAVSIVDPTHGYMGVSYVSFIPVLTKAVQELDIKVQDLSSLDLNNANSFGSLIKNFLSDAGNQIENLYSKIIHSDRIETKTLCVGSTCVSEEQFLKMLQQSENSDEDGGPVDQTPIDVCLNIDGDQSVIPAGYHLDSEQNCVEDLTPDPLPPADPEFPPAQESDSNSVDDQSNEEGNLNQAPTPISEVLQSE